MSRDKIFLIIFSSLVIMTFLTILMILTGCSDATLETGGLRV